MEMKKKENKILYIRDEKRLKEAYRILSEKQNTIKIFYKFFLDNQVRNTNLLEDCFLASINERRGASYTRSQEAVREFKKRKKELIQILNSDKDPEEKARKAFEFLVCNIPNVDQKIAALYLKFLVVYEKKWSELEPYLFVPLDRVVLKLLGPEVLRICNRNLWRNSPLIGVTNTTSSTKKDNSRKRLYYKNNKQKPLSNYRKFLIFQDELKRVAEKVGVNRIVIDELWIIGQLFCKEYPLCHVCWLQRICPRSKKLIQKM